MIGCCSDLTNESKKQISVLVRRTEKNFASLKYLTRGVHYAPRDKTLHIRVTIFLVHGAFLFVSCGGRLMQFQCEREYGANIRTANAPLNVQSSCNFY